MSLAEGTPFRQSLLRVHFSRCKNVDPDEPVVVCPVDPYVNLDYFEAVKKLSELASDGQSNLSLLGIAPTFPSSSYGYIMPESKDSVSRVKRFIEKPNETAAAEYIEQGALWNGGVFAYKLSYLLDISRKCSAAPITRPYMTITRALPR